MQFHSEAEMARALGDKFYFLDLEKGRTICIVKETKVRRPYPGVGDILEAVRIVTGVGPKTVRGRCRTIKVMQARTAAIHLVYGIIGRSLKWTGRHLGRDHTTVLYNMRKVCPAVEAMKPVVLAELRRKFPGVDDRIAEVNSETFQRPNVPKYHHVNKK